ncbi:MAG TPA: ATP synthase F1 subunit gamma [Balneola sp.]|jgi:F-type H+-transporting ATPase subunit gamma|nr:ATP synthase F1 subunit gamma [Bacteroidota bacterium]MAC04505.1 ATP synthase F1 subunit gamma [Balneola sp.]MAO76786.1 ATP synthase F1 subunit gamma [Balneola sp.]MBF65194.1 ATP synthase F1 subunit gamma [Balneola sp.]HAW79842.1 ATP synthase F1 subunit gamma [Balneola sp.]|tara:strand:+ start:7861 stop:8751 length:891 start_codon:yes stop_codon:yes gene_type:complete
MANLRDIRNRISSVNSTQQITKAMKMVAAAKLRKAQERMTKTRPYAAKIQNVVGRLADSGSISSPLVEKSETNQNLLFIVVGSDRGLCGGFNNNLFKELEKRLAKDFSTQLEAGTVSLVTIGKKATAHFKKRSYNVVESFPGFFDTIEYDPTSAIMDSATKDFVDGVYDEVYIVFNEFKSVIAQNRKIDKVLPIDPNSFGVKSEDDSKTSIDYIYEPNSEAILEKLLPLHLNTQLWKAILESNASEQGARMSAMDSATENAKELERDLKLKYNQARQSAITTEISEIVSGAQALSE